MTYAERIAEFQRATGHLPGEMNKLVPVAERWHIGPDGKPDYHDVVSLEPLTPAFVTSPPIYSYDNGETWTTEDRPVATGPTMTVTRVDRERGEITVSLEPPVQSSGPGRCNRFTRAVALGDPTPCKLPANHEGPHSP